MRLIVLAVAILAVVYILINVVVSAGNIWGEEYATPAWDERSVSPPKLY